MILQRLATSIRKQDWFTVLIETLIVVFGVFLGIQLGNWNEARQDQSGLLSAVDRLKGEAELNLKIADGVIERIDDFEDGRIAAMRAISSCDASEEAQRGVESAIEEMMSDLSPELVDFSLTELGRRDEYLDRLSDEFREAMNTYQGDLAEEKSALASNNVLLWDQHVIKHPAIGAEFTPDDPETSTVLKLRVPLAELCLDAEFQREFAVTAGFVESTKLRLKRFQTRTRDYLDALQDEQARLDAR
ncbi:hypothetical protein WNY37_16910 [Henriciella sp. AS95]|uniref:hypothetical protein n=1 Tax=Henriciella sp. AS95 TaxID=3135782 RepID=UPI0031829F80